MQEERATNDLVYESVSVQHPSIRYTKIVPTNGTSAVVLNPTSSYGPVELLSSPASCINWGESILQWDVAVGPSLSTTLGTVMPANGLMMLQRVVVTLQSGALLMDINNVSKLACATTNSLSGFAESMNNTCGTSRMSLTSAAASLSPFDIVNRNNSAAVNLTGDTAVFDSTYLSARDFVLGQPPADNTDTVANARFISYRLNLGDAFKNVFLGLKKLLFMQDTVSVQLYFNNTNAFGWLATSAAGANYPTNLHTGAAALTSCTVSNIQLVLAQEQNIDLVRQVVALTRDKGMSFPIGYCYSQKTTQSGTSQGIQYQIGQSYGSALNYIVWAPFSVPTASTDSFGVAYQNGINGVARGGAASPTLVSYLDYMNQLPVSTAGQLIDCSHGEQWSANSRSLAGSMVLSIVDQSNHFAHFTSYVSGPLHSFDQTSQQGLSLKEPLIYSINSNWTSVAGSSTNHFVWVFSSRILTINSAGVSLT